jgi:hypothetical protein
MLTILLRAFLGSPVGGIGSPLPIMGRIVDGGLVVPPRAR